MIGIAGRIDPFKGQLLFAEAARLVLRRCGGVRFLIIGNIHDPVYHRQLIRYLQQHDLEQQVLLTGWRNDMPAVLSALDILVSLSGGSILFEGMAAGKAVVSAGDY